MLKKRDIQAVFFSIRLRISSKRGNAYLFGRGFSLGGFPFSCRFFSLEGDLLSCRGSSLLQGLSSLAGGLPSLVSSSAKKRSGGL